MADNLLLPIDAVDTNYEFEVDLEDLVWRFRFHWNETDQAWYMDLLGLDNGNDFKGIKVIGGINLLDPYAIRELGQLYLVDAENGLQDPDRDGFGDRYQLLYVLKENVDAFLSA